MRLDPFVSQKVDGTVFHWVGDWLIKDADPWRSSSVSRR